MDRLHRTLARARRRLWLGQTVRVLGWGALTGLVVAAGLLLTERLAGVSVPGWAYLATAAAVLIAGPVWAWFRRPSLHQAAATLDARLGLKDRLATALYARQQRHPFAAQVVADANHSAEKADLRRAVPISAGHGWRYALGMTGIVAALAVFLEPGGALLGGDDAKQASAAKDEARATQNDIQQVKASVERIEQNDQQSEKRDLGDLQKQLASLSNRDLTNPGAKKDAAAKISKIKERLDEVTESKEKQVQALQNAMSQLDSGQQGPADRFENALRRGDYEAAKQALQTMENKIRNGDYSAKQKQRLQQQLDQLSKQLNQAAQKAKQQANQAGQSAQQQLKQHGLSQKQINQLKQQGMNQQAVQKALQQQGMNKQQAKQVAKQVNQKQQKSKQSQQTGQQSQGLGSSLGQMAQSLKQSQSGQKGGQSKQGQSGQQGSQGQKAAKGQGKQSAGGGQFKQGSYSAGQQLKQMKQMKQSLQQAQRAQGKAKQAMQRAAGQGQQQKAGGSGQSNQRQGGGRGGLRAGSGEGGPPLGKKQAASNAKRHARDDTHRGKGRVISSWEEKGDMAAGDANVGFDRTVKSAQDQAEQAVNEDRVPRRYHGTIKDYFNQLPESAKEQQGAPPAPQ